VYRSRTITSITRVVTAAVYLGFRRAFTMSRNERIHFLSVRARRCYIIIIIIIIINNIIITIIVIFFFPTHTVHTRSLSLAVTESKRGKEEAVGRKKKPKTGAL
jgi:hypothetical protein